MENFHLIERNIRTEQEQTNKQPEKTQQEKDFDVIGKRTNLENKFQNDVFLLPSPIPHSPKKYPKANKQG